MKKLISLFALLFCFSFFAMNANALIPVTVSGTAVTVPPLSASYTSLLDALADLNLITSYTTDGTIILTCTGGNTETAPIKGFIIGSTSLNPLLSATNTVTINTSGGTVTIDAGVGNSTPGSADPDGMISIRGADYVTIDGLTLTDGNAANPTTMEFGIGLFKMDATDGVQNNTIQNCTITLNRINNANGSGPSMDGSVGIEGYNSTNAAATTALTIASANGTNSNNKFYTNSIQNCNIGIGLTGFASSTFGDSGNDIGGAATGTGNTILNYGGGGTSSPAAGIRLRDQIGGANVSYNTINNNNGGGINHGTTLRGIYGQSGISASVTISNNSITVKSGAATNALTAIENVIGATAAGNTVNIINNTITGCTYTTATSGVFTGIVNSASAATVNITGNQITSNSTNAASGTNILIQNSGAATVAININSNNINGWTFNAPTSTALTCISNTGGAATCALSISNNNFQGVTYSAASTGAFLCINTTALVLSETINTNNFNNLTVNSSASALGFLIAATNATPTVTIDGNYVTTQFSNTNATGGANYLAIANNISGTGPTTGSATISNNNISNVTYKTTTGFGAMLYWVSGSGAACAHNITANLNTFSNISNTGGTAAQTAGSYGILVSNGSSNVVSNNTVTNISASGGSAIGIFGGAVSTNAAGVTNVNNNLIQDIKCISVSTTVGTNAIGIQVQGGPGNNIFKNKIYDLSHTGIGTVTGIVIAQLTVGSINNVYNNLVGRISAPNSLFFQAVRGINVANNVANTVNLYYNNVSFGGNCGGQSYCVYMSSVNPTITVKNNILVNKAVPTSGLEQMVYFRVGSLTPTYTILSDNNLLYAGTPGPLNLIYADGAVSALTNQQQTLPAFKIFAGPTRESYSYSGDPALLADLSPDPSNPACWLINGNGMAISSISSDIAGNPRSTTIAGGGTDIGAYEFTPSVAPPVVSSGPLLSPLAAASFEVGTATVASVNVTGGSVSNVDLQYYSGTVPPGLPGSPPVTDGYGNVYWNLVPTGSGFTYTLTIHYSPALLGTITPETAIKVAIEDPPNNGLGLYTPYPQGTGDGQSNVDLVNHNITVTGLTEMGKFIITDATSALPVELASFVSAVNGRNVTLNWSTSTEENNSGFDVERSSINGSWSNIGNVAGNGTTANGHSYSINDRNLATGNYSYRLKQIDFNGNFKYYNLSSEVVIGVPEKYDLSQNYPNPFNPSTKINYDIPFDGKVTLTVFDMSGKEVAMLVNEVKTAGYYSINFNASSLSSGTYFYRINAEGNGQNFVSTKKMMLVK